MIFDLVHHSKEDALKSNIDKIIASSQDETLALEQLLEDIPGRITGYANLRTILRNVKRGNSLEDTLAKFAFDSCPPVKEYADSGNCGNISCAECWQAYIDYYTSKVLEKK